MIVSYGLTEAPSVVSMGRRDGQGHVPGSSGRPLPHLAVRIVGDDGRTLPAGESGEICVGPADDRYRMMLGYWDRPDASAEALAGGELHTGDIGLLDADGLLHIRDRKSLVILRGGANVYPAEVERVLVEHPAVAAGAVLGVPDDRLGERVAAVVEAAAGATVDVDDVRSFLLANLAKYKVPEQITVVDAAAAQRHGQGHPDRAAGPAHDRGRELETTQRLLSRGPVAGVTDSRDVSRPRQDEASLTSDQLSPGTSTWMMSGAAASHRGICSEAAAKWADSTWAFPASSSRKSSISTHRFGSSALRYQSKEMHPGSARDAVVKSPTSDGKSSAYLARTGCFTTIRIIPEPLCPTPLPVWLGYLTPVSETATTGRGSMR